MNQVQTRGLRLPAAVSAAVRAHAGAAYPAECCGALLGHAAGATGERVAARAVAVGNDRADAPDRRYRIPAVAVRALEARAASEGLAVIGFYHSHPDGRAEPSAVDCSLAWPWYSYLIVAVAGGRAGALAAWRLREDRDRFLPEPLLPAPEEEA